MAYVVVELDTEVTAHDAVPCILRISRSGGAGERGILVEDVVHAYEDLAQLVTEDLLAYVGVAEEVLLVVVVREADVLVIRCAGREGETARKYELQIARSRMVEVAVCGAARGERVLGFVVGAVPREGEVHVLGDVATKHDTRIVTQGRGDVLSAVYQRRGLRIRDAGTEVQVR